MISRQRLVSLAFLVEAFSLTNRVERTSPIMASN